MLKPSIPKEPTPPKLDTQLGPTLVITAKEAKFYESVCDEYKEVDDDGARVYRDEDLLKKYSLSRSAACDWAVYGQTVQGTLNLENIFVQQATYAQQMREYVKFLRLTIDQMYELSEKIREEATKPPPKPEKKWYHWF